MTKPSLFWHRWFGILGGAWLFLVALSGSILVFYEELDRALNPALFVAATPASQPGAARAIAAAERAFPGGIATYLSLPASPQDSLIVYLEDRPGHAGAIGPDGREVYVDPGTGAVQGSRVWGRLLWSRMQVMPIIYRLHYTLLAGETGVWLLGLVALAWLIDHGVALPLALRSARRWQLTFRMRPRVRGHKRVFDLHRAGAMWLLPVTAMLAFSGAYFNLPDQFRAAIGLFSTPAPDIAEVRALLPTPLAAPPVDADAALATARARLPGVALSSIAFDPARGLWLLRAHDPRDLLAEYGAREIVVDARSGAMLGAQHFADGTAADAVMAWQYPLHSGKILGWPGRILILLTGLVTCSLTVTGYWLWWKRRAARRSTPRSRALPAGLQPAE